MSLGPHAAAIFSAMPEVGVHPLETIEPKEARTGAAGKPMWPSRTTTRCRTREKSTRVAYARRACRSSCPLYEGQRHSSFIMGAVIPTGAVVLQKAVGRMQRALGSPNMPNGAGAGQVVA